MQPFFILLQHILPHHLLSRLTGVLAECRWPWLKNFLISLFVKAFKVDLSEAVISDIDQFACFNDFFTRELKPGVRNLCKDPGILISPVDGAISESGKISQDRVYQAKGKHYTLDNLLGGEEELVSEFIDGTFMTIYLSPKDYHRVHCPMDAELVASYYLPGSLFSVNETSVNHIPELFSRNERLVMVFNTEYGKMTLVMVGAMIVAGIKTVWRDTMYPAKTTTRDNLSVPIGFKAGDELGQFQLGSTVVMLFQPDVINWDAGMAAQKALRLGERLGSFNSPG